jgi:diguanylate cyclase (GGDEF)-like protein
MDSIRSLQITGDAGQQYSITTSLGIGTSRQTDSSLRDLFDRTDQALYAAKHRGRNQIASLDAGDEAG